LAAEANVGSWEQATGTERPRSGCPPVDFREGGPLPPPVNVDHDDHDTTIKQCMGERGRRKMVRRWLAAACDDGGGGNGARALLGQ